MQYDATVSTIHLFILHGITVKVYSTGVPIAKRNPMRPAMIRRLIPTVIHPILPLCVMYFLNCNLINKTSLAGFLSKLNCTYLYIRIIIRGYTSLSDGM